MSGKQKLHFGEVVISLGNFKVFKNYFFNLKKLKNQKNYKEGETTETKKWYKIIKTMSDVTVSGEIFICLNYKTTSDVLTSDNQSLFFFLFFFWQFLIMFF